MIPWLLSRVNKNMLGMNANFLQGFWTGCSYQQGFLGFIYVHYTDKVLFKDGNGNLDQYIRSIYIENIFSFPG